MKFNSTIHGDKGNHGKGKDKRGANGADTVIKVPRGTTVNLREEDGQQTPIADIVDNVPQLVARGGDGGWGNARFVSSTNQEPVLAQRGAKGEAVVLFLELKLLADVGLIARPNAGKSTLLSTCSAAKPKVAAYPFTTVEPVVGVVRNRDTDFVMMEVPGLLEGAHLGVGLGHQFLRHAERTRVYIHVLDGMSEDPAADLKMLKNELKMFNPVLADKREIIAVNKVDITEARARKVEIEKSLQAEDLNGAKTGDVTPIMFISAATGEGVDALLGKVVELLGTMAEETQETEPIVPQTSQLPRRTVPDAVYKEGGVYVVVSEEMERLVELADTRDNRVIVQLWREMTKRGLAQRLEKFGIEAGKTIRIGKVEVEWF